MGISTSIEAERIQTPEIVLRRIAIRVVAMLPDDKADAERVLDLARSLQESFIDPASQVPLVRKP